MHVKQLVVSMVTFRELELLLCCSRAVVTCTDLSYHSISVWPPCTETFNYFCNVSWTFMARVIVHCYVMAGLLLQVTIGPLIAWSQICLWSCQRHCSLSSQTFEWVTRSWRDSTNRRALPTSPIKRNNIEINTIVMMGKLTPVLPSDLVKRSWLSLPPVCRLWSRSCSPTGVV